MKYIKSIYQKTTAHTYEDPFSKLRKMSFKNKKKKNENVRPNSQARYFLSRGIQDQFEREREREKARRVALAEARELGGGERR